MGRPIQFCLVYRDMWQSAGKYMPRVEQLTQVAPHIVEMGCFARVETNGGGFEQINLLFGENPNASVRAWTQPFNDVGIQTQMLERALNGLRMSPVPVDVRKLLFKVKKKQGTDIARIFCGLNDPRNVSDSIRYAKEGGMIAQAALCITVSEVHTVEYYLRLAEQFIEAGADEIAIKDMAGIGRPVSIGKIVKGIKDRHPKILVQYHGHATPGFSVASTLEAVRNGADIIDVGMEPLSWGTGHADLLTIHAMLQDAGYQVPDINMKAYMKVRTLTQNFVDDFLGYYISPRNHLMNSLLIGSGLPGGMMGSLMADLEKNLESLNKWMEKQEKDPISIDEILIRLFEEVEYVRPKLGSPPLVTPYSQYVKNVALMNVIQMYKGKERWSMIDENTWAMILGNAGKLPGELGKEIVALAKAEGREFYEGHPQDLYPDDLNLYRQKMKEKGWDLGQDEEELMEYAMHPKEYEAYKSGKAKKDFLADLEKRRAAKQSKNLPASIESPTPSITKEAFQPKKMRISVNGEQFEVTIDYDTDSDVQATPSTPPPMRKSVANAEVRGILAPIEGKFYRTKDAGERGVKIGDFVKIGDNIGYIEAMKVNNAIAADKEGKVVEICFKDGDDVFEDDILVKIQ